MVAAAATTATAAAAALGDRTKRVREGESRAPLIRKESKEGEQEKREREKGRETKGEVKGESIEKKNQIHHQIGSLSSLFFAAPHDRLFRSSLLYFPATASAAAADDRRLCRRRRLCCHCSRRCYIIRTDTRAHARRALASCLERKRRAACARSTDTEQQQQQQQQHSPALTHCTRSVSLSLFFVQENGGNRLRCLPVC